jgi:hypothetical protein
MYFNIRNILPILGRFLFGIPVKAEYVNMAKPGN